MKQWMRGARPVRSFPYGKMRLIADFWSTPLQMAVRWFGSRRLVSISSRRGDHIATSQLAALHDKPCGPTRGLSEPLFALQLGRRLNFGVVSIRSVART
jgi:hypothetical protein